MGAVGQILSWPCADVSYKAYKGRRDQRVCRRLVLIHMVATNLRGKTHQRSTTKVFPLQSTVRCWAGPTEGKETKSSSGCPGTSGSDTDPFEDVSIQGLGISWTSALSQVAYFSPLFWQDVWPSTAFWPASHGLVDHGGPCNAASELTVGAVLCNATTSESARSCHCCSKFYSALDSVRWRKTSARSLNKDNRRYIESWHMEVEATMKSSRFKRLKYVF